MSWIIKILLAKLSYVRCSFTNLNMEKLRRNLLFFVLINFLWLLLRTGTKPSRMVYPCQRTAVGNISFSISALIPLTISSPVFVKKKNILPKSGVVFIAIILLGICSGEFLLTIENPNPFQEVRLVIESKGASNFPASDIFVVNNESTPEIDQLIRLMGSQNLKFYKSSSVEDLQGPSGLIAFDDVVLLKINSQWTERGGTNTDLLKDLINTILNHPDGFIGEIIIADNHQGYGGMDHTKNNAENTSQSTQAVVDVFSSVLNVSTYDWSKIRHIQVSEYSDGDTSDGYIVYDSMDPDTGIYVSYPKFQTEFGTNVSFKHGIWNGTGFENRLKVVNLPVLKSHFIYGVTGSIKNYMGVQSEILNGGLANGHMSIATGGMGTLLTECGLPTLNIIDAVWVNANPYPDSYCGPSTGYKMATRVNMLIAGVDPIALDFWAAKHILIQTAISIGYDDTHTLDPENTKKSGLREAFGVWLGLTKDEMLRSDINVTIDEENMNIITSSIIQGSSTTTTDISGFEISLISFLSLVILTSIFLQKRQKRES